MADKERTKRLQVHMGAEELAAVEDFRFRERMPTLAAAARELLRRGLQAGDRGPPLQTETLPNSQTEY
jgi:hypothetical protein